MLTTASFLLIIPVSRVAVAQIDLRGQVVDAATGTPLPSAHLQIEGTNHGTTTNAEGRFALYVDRSAAVLVASFLGYKSSRITVSPRTPLPLQIGLEPDTLPLEELVVSGEDPAVELMRRVIARKRALLDSLGSYRAEGFTRFLLYRGETLVQLREWITEAYWSPASGTREIVRASRRTPPGSGDFRFAGPEAVPNFYDDEVALLGMSFVGPTHPNALSLYTFRIGKPLSIDGRRLDVVYVTPGARGQAAFVGRLLIVTGEDILFSVYLRPAWHMIPPPPVQERVIHYEQHFERTSEGLPVPVDLRMEGSVQFGRTGASHPPARFTQVSRLTYHIAGWPVPDSLAASARRIFVEPFAAYRDFLFAGNPADIPLTTGERAAVSRINPRLSLQDVFSPTGLLAAYGAVKVAEPSSDAAFDRPEPALVRFPRPWAWYNRVDGAHPGLRLPLRAPSWSAEVAAGYSVERKRPTARVSAAFAPAIGPRGVGPTVLMAVSDETATTYTSRTYAPLIQGIGTYFGYDDPFDYLWRREIDLSAGMRFRTARLVGGFRVSDEKSLEQRAEWEGWLRTNFQRPNPDVIAGTLAQPYVEMQIGSMGGASLVPHSSGLRIRAAWCPSGIGASGEAFALYEAEWSWSTRTVLRRRDVPPVFRIRGWAGLHAGSAPPQSRFALDVGMGPLSPFGSFRSADDLPYVGTRGVAVFWEHDFGTLPFETLRLPGLAETGLGVTLHGAHGVLEHDSALRGSLPQPEGPHHEIGLSLTELFRYPVRVDFTWRLDRPGFRIGVGVRSINVK